MFIKMFDKLYMKGEVYTSFQDYKIKFKWMFILYQSVENKLVGICNE